VTDGSIPLSTAAKEVCYAGRRRQGKRSEQDRDAAEEADTVTEKEPVEENSWRCEQRPKNGTQEGRSPNDEEVGPAVKRKHW
jgi:hypothetical protein